MALTLIHSEFKALIDEITGLDSDAVYIPESVPLPAMAYALDSISRDIQSNLRNSTISAHVFSVFIADTEFKTVQELAQSLIDSLDQYSDTHILLTLVTDCNDNYDASKEVFYKALTVTVRVRE